MPKRGSILKVAVVGLFTVACFSIFGFDTKNSVSKSDDITAEIAKYKSWGSVSKAPYEVLSVLTGENLSLRKPEHVPLNFSVEGSFG